MRPGLAELEAVLDASQAGAMVQAVLPIGGRPRQLPARTLMLGMMLAQQDDRPAHLKRVHEALLSLPVGDQERLGVVSAKRHILTYRQIEHMNRRAQVGLKASTKGLPSPVLCEIADALLEASIPAGYKELSSDLAVDWTDLETFARPGDDESPSVDSDASFGHRKSAAPGHPHEVFFGYYLQLATMVGELAGKAVPELVRRMLLATASIDPPTAFVAVLAQLHESGTALGDVIADCGYSFRSPERWALPLRALGARLVQDLHPHDRGPKGTYGGAVIANGCLYCPATPALLLSLGPLGRGAGQEETDRHDKMTTELSRYKLGPISSLDADGYHRVSCPALLGKIRCPLRPESMALGFDRPEVASPPDAPGPCCTQRTMTVPPSVAPKTTQRHDYPGRQWRQSYARRSAAERSNATMKDPARTSIERGWCRMTNLPSITLFLVCAVVVRNLRVVDAFEARQRADQKRALQPQPRPRRRQRTTLVELASGGSQRAP